MYLRFSVPTIFGATVIPGPRDARFYEAMQHRPAAPTWRIHSFIVSSICTACLWAQRVGDHRCSDHWRRIDGQRRRRAHGGERVIIRWRIPVQNSLSAAHLHAQSNGEGGRRDGKGNRGELQPAESARLSGPAPRAGCGWGTGRARFARERRDRRENRCDWVIPRFKARGQLSRGPRPFDCSLAQDRLELGEQLFNRIEVWPISAHSVKPY